MVNTTTVLHTTYLARAARLVRLYVVIVIATVAALAVLSVFDPSQATAEAWVHALIVSLFAVLLPVRLRAARRGSSRGVVAVGVIAIVLLAVNVVEALIPGLFPIWMRVEMIGIAVLMAVLAGTVLRGRR